MKITKKSCLIILVNRHVTSNYSPLITSSDLRDVKIIGLQTDWTNNRFGFFSSFSIQKLKQYVYVFIYMNSIWTLNCYSGKSTILRRNTRHIIFVKTESNQLCSAFVLIVTFCWNSWCISALVGLGIMLENRNLWRKDQLYFNYIIFIYMQTYQFRWKEEASLFIKVK
jgi:hypothetical protein